MSSEQSKRCALADLAGAVETMLIGARRAADAGHCPELLAAELCRLLPDLESALNDAREFGLGLHARGALWGSGIERGDNNGPESDSGSAGRNGRLRSGYE